MPDKKKEVAKKEEVQTPAMLGGQGVLGAIDPKDLILPRIELGQAMSPSVQDGKNKAGEIYNSITNEAIEAPIHVIPVKNEKNFIRWVPRSEGGGMVYRTDDPQDKRVLEDTKWGTDGSKPLCTAYLNFLCLIKGQEMPLVLSFKDTSYKVGRKLLTMMAMNGGAIRSYVLGSASTTNNFGTFFIPTIDQGGTVEGEDLDRAVALHKSFAQTKMNFADERTDTASASDEIEEF